MLEEYYPISFTHLFDSRILTVLGILTIVTVVITISIAVVLEPVKSLVLCSMRGDSIGERFCSLYLVVTDVIRIEVYSTRSKEILIHFL